MISPTVFGEIGGEKRFRPVKIYMQILFAPEIGFPWHANSIRPRNRLCRGIPTPVAPKI